MATPQTFVAMTTNFLKDVKKAGKIRDLTARIGPDQTEEDMFVYVWGLDEAHRCMSPSLVPSGKSRERAESYINQGGAMAGRGDVKEALEYYNLAIMSAPHPTVVPGDEGDGLDWNNNVYGGGKEWSVLALALARRSDLFFDLRRYDKALEDVDNALMYNSQEPLRQELLERKEKCIVFMKEGGKTCKNTFPLPDSTLVFAYGCQMPPVVPDPSPNIPSLSASVSLAYTPDEGRFLVASKDIHPGEVVGVEESYSSAPRPGNLSTHCCVCLLRTSAALPCPCCSAVIFCSWKCRSKGLTGCHGKECAILPTLLSLDMGANPILAYRIITRTTLASLRLQIPNLRAEAEVKPHEQVGFDDEGVYRSGHYRPVYHLVTNKRSRPHTDLLRRCLQAFVVTKLVIAGGQFFVEENEEGEQSGERRVVEERETEREDEEPGKNREKKDNKKRRKDEENRTIEIKEGARVKGWKVDLSDVVLVGSTVLHHLMNLLANAFAIGELQIDSEGQHGSRMEACAGGVFMASSLLNNSCNPSVAAFTHGSTQVLRAVRSVPVGHQLTYNYGSFYCVEDEDARRAALLKQYSFECSCEACENGWYELFHTSSGVIVECPRCLATGNPTAACDCPATKEQIQRAVDIIEVTYRQITNGEDVEDHIKDIVGALELMERFARLPCCAYLDAQELLKFYHDTQGSHVWV